MQVDEKLQQNAVAAKVVPKVSGMRVVQVPKATGQPGLPGTHKPKKTVGLCMIVKNERDVIARCMRHVSRLIDHFVIVDTGSTDGTQDIIRQTGKELCIPGEVHERPWKNFGHNRTEAIELARGKTDYLFFIDADEILQMEPGFCLPELTVGAYSITLVHGNLRYQRTCLVDGSLPWRYEGVLHEYLTTTGRYETAKLGGISVLYTTEGARSKNPMKFVDDAKVFMKAVEDEPNNERYWFYLGQSWRDAYRTVKPTNVEYAKSAITAYLKRAEMKGWDEETWNAAFQAARMMDFAQFPPDEVESAYLRAYQMRPSRAEPLVWLAAFHRFKGNFSKARDWALQAADIPMPEDRLFVEKDCYGIKRDYELAAALAGCGAKALALQSFEWLAKKTELKGGLRLLVEKSIAQLNGEYPQKADNRQEA